MRLSPYRLLVLLVLVAFGSFTVIAFNPATQAYADIASTVNVVPVNGGRVSAPYASVNDAGTSVVLRVRNQDALVNSVYFGSGLGNAIVGLSITQVNSNTNFGVQAYNNGNAYPYSSFLQYDNDSSTFFYRCLNNSDCHTQYVANLKHDADYVISAFALQYDAGDIKNAINNLQAYISRCQDWLQIVANNVTNVNNSINSLTTSVQQWANVLDNHIQNVNTSTYNNGLKLAELDKKMAKLLENQQKADEQAKQDRENAQNKSDDANSQFEDSKNSHKPDTAKLSSLVSQLASAKPSDCTVNLKTEGLHIPLDFCDNSLPSWVTSLIGLVSAVSAVFATVAVVRKTLGIFRQVNKE